MVITLPSEIEDQFSEPDVALHLAIGLHVDDRVTLGQAAAIAGLSVPAFLAELGKRGLPVHYTLQDAQADILTVQRMAKS